MTLRFHVLVVFLALGAVAAADVVILESGGRIEGRATRVGDQVHVESMAGGTKVPASSVARIDEAHRAPIEIYEERMVALRAEPGPEAHLEMIAWLLKNRGRRLVARHVEAVSEAMAGTEDAAKVLALARSFAGRLESPLRPVWERVLQLEPDQEEARRALGFRRLGEGWATEEEWQAAQGNVLFEGRWIPREMREMMLEERAAKLKRRIRDLALREAKVVKRERTVEAGRKANVRKETQLRRQAREQARRESELDERERDVESRERVLDRLRFCRLCRSYYSRDHFCPGAWTWCVRCQGYFRGGHRCR